MDGVFRYWGFSPESWARSIEQHGWLEPQPAGPARVVFGRVEPTLALLEEAGPYRENIESGWWSWFLLPEGPQVRGDSLARVETGNGDKLDLVTRTTAGKIRLHFDVDATISLIRNERYLTHRPPLYVRMGVLRLPLPATLRMGGLKLLRAVRSLNHSRVPPFPNGALDPSVDFWLYWLRTQIERATGEQAIPLWPEGKRCAVALTHDIDTAYAFRRPGTLERFTEIEKRRGLRSTWMVVGSLLEGGRVSLDELCAEGHEIGFHSARHDHRLAFAPSEEMRRELSEIEPLRNRYGAVGFRSPNYLRTPRLFRELDAYAEYDATVPSFARPMSAMTPRTDGCSTSLPFTIEGTDLLELPNTVLEDVSLEFEGCTPEKAAQRQAKMATSLWARHSLISVCTHPEPQLTARPQWMEVYGEFVKHVVSLPDVWHARLVDINRHWRARAAMIEAQWNTSQQQVPSASMLRHSEPVAAR
ncbi:MAG: polysaccharide deacetylase family protein [Phycisphaerae bacterium]|nr:polysaccharide deacetylase family protein [Phycisphaerae bacterium]